MSVNDYDQILYEAIEQIDLDETAHGIAMQVVYRGYDSLSTKQRYIYDTQVVPRLKKLAEEEELARRYDPS